MQPKQSDIEKAKEYIRKRLNAELSMIAHLESLLKKAAEKIVMIVYADNPYSQGQEFSLSNLSNKAKMQIAEIIRMLRDAIGSDFDEMCVPADVKDRDYIILWIKRGKNDISHNDRLDLYLNRFLREMEVLIEAGLFLKLTSKSLARSIGLNLKHPYANPDLIDGIKKNVTYGKGRTNSMMTAIGNLARFGIARGWMKAKIEEDKRNGIRGWYVMRGSTYPCDLCDSYLGIQYYEDSLPPYHSHCCCFFVPLSDIL